MNWNILRTYLKILYKYFYMSTVLYMATVHTCEVKSTWSKCVTAENKHRNVISVIIFLLWNTWSNISDEKTFPQPLVQSEGSKTLPDKSKRSWFQTCCEGSGWGCKHHSWRSPWFSWTTPGLLLLFEDSTHPAGFDREGTSRSEFHCLITVRFCDVILSNTLMQLPGGEILCLLCFVRNVVL